MNDRRQRLYLIDGYSTIFRAYYAIRDLSNARGQPTNAVYGFLQMLRKLLREDSPDLVGVALDVSRQTFRSERYAEYKANRSPMPDDLRSQIPWIRQTIEAFGIPILEQENYEADDVLGSLAKKAAEAGYEVVLVTADKDLMQLVDDHVKLYHTGRDKLYDRAAVEEDFGVPPDRVVDVLSLTGDSVDNIPGVAGIGAKGARTLIREYGSLEELLERAHEVKRKTYREGLQNHPEDALMSKELATIEAGLPVPFDPEALRHDAPSIDALREIYRELDFFSLLKELDSEGGGERREIGPAEQVDSARAWADATRSLRGRIPVGAIGNAEVLGLAVGAGEGRVVFADFRGAGLEAAALDSVAAWLEDPDIELVGHDLKEVVRLAARGSSTPLQVRARLIDTMLLAYLLRSSVRSFTLEEVALERLHHKVVGEKEAGWEEGEPPMMADPRLRTLAAERIVLPGELAERMLVELSEDDEASRGAEKIYREIEEPLIPVLVEMEEAGIYLDVEFLAEMSKELESELQALEEQIYELAGETFNINSSQQLGTILFDRLGYPVVKRTRKTKNYSTSAETLEELAARGFDLPERLIRYRELTKLKSTYVDALPLLVAEDGRLHTRFNQAVAATGRLSSANPNLQNIPVRTEIGQRIRKAFKASEGYALLVADYSQIELRVLAHIARETSLIEAFEAGADIHRSTAASVFGVDPDLVTDDQRRAAKVINFGIIYGMSAFGLGQTLGISPKEADVFIKAYFEQFPGVAAYTEETLDRATEELCVHTLYGRTRWLPDLRSRNRNLRENAKRMAINARIQGTAADLLKLAMIAVGRRLRLEFPASKLLLTVHDELVLEVPQTELADVSALVVEEMEGVADLAVPLRVDVGSGRDWYEAKV